MSMAGVSNLHRLNLHEEDGDLYIHPKPSIIDFDSFSPPNNSFFEDYTAPFNLGFDLNENLGCEYDDPNCLFYGVEDEEEQMNFVTDLFEARETHVTGDPILEFDMARDEVSLSSLEFGFGPGLGGLRVTGMDSESDSEEFEVDSGFIDNDNIIDVDVVDDDDDEYGINNANNYQFSDNEREEFEWEEVSDRLQDERENLNSMIERIEEITVSTDISSESEVSEGGEEERNIEWEVLLAVNNLERNFDFDSAEENIEDGSEIPHINHPEDYILTMEYDALFAQLVENENALKGSPPAAKNVVENLPCVVLTKEEVEENNSVVICAVCKDEVAIGEKVIKMPCCHLYHADCILPWLGIRNTCPVCRHELPTDDADYEKRRTERGDSRMDTILVNDLEGRYNFELWP